MDLIKCNILNFIQSGLLREFLRLIIEFLVTILIRFIRTKAPSPRISANLAANGCTTLCLKASESPIIAGSSACCSWPYGGGLLTPRPP